MIDTNILLSAALKQNDYRSTIDFLVKTEELNIPVLLLDFSIYSACVHLSGRGENDLFKQLLKDISEKRNFTIHRPSINEILELESINLKLDFDDKLHYHIAKKKNLTLISYDTDFDKTDLKRLTPKQAIKQLEFS